MNCLVGGPLLVGGLGPGPPPLKSGPVLSQKGAQTTLILIGQKARQHVRTFHEKETTDSNDTAGTEISSSSSSNACININIIQQQ